MRLGTVLGDTYTLNPKSFGNPADTARNSVLWGSAPFVTGMHKAPAPHASENLGSNPGGGEGGCSFPSLLFDRSMAADFG